MPDKHSDRNKVRSYELARIVAARLLENPALVEEGRKYLERHLKHDPAQRAYYELWSGLIDLGAEEVASRLLADSPEGELLRDTRPVFYVPSNAERADAFDRVR